MQYQCVLLQYFMQYQCVLLQYFMQYRCVLLQYFMQYRCVLLQYFMQYRCVLLQAVDHGASLPSVILFLPFVHLVDEFEEGALGDGRVAVHRPAQELELLHHAVPVLWLEDTGMTGMSKQAHPHLPSGVSEDGEMEYIPK